MKKWAEIEDAKYSWLYKNNYPIGQPMKCIKKFLIPNNLSCIDLGCGRGTLSSYFTNYTGVDVSKYIINYNLKTRKGKYIHASLDDLSAITDTYDIAICSDVMEHIPLDQVDDVLNAISKLECKEFYFVISTRKSVILDPQNNNLHLSVLKHSEWKSKLSQFFSIIEEEILNTLYTAKCLKK